MVETNGWLDGWEHIDLDDGLTYTGGPWKLVYHSAEGSTMEGLINTFKRNPGIASQLGMCWKTQRKVQFISLFHSGKALRNLPGGVQTNRDKVIQIEIVDFWTQTPNIPDSGLRFLGEGLAEIWLAVGGAFKLELGYKPLVGPEDGYTARVDAPQRYSAAEWDEFNAVAGHCNVPENEHTDPGKLNMDRIFYYAKQYINNISPDKEEEDMASVLVLDPDAPDGKVWECLGLQRRWVHDQEELALLTFLGSAYFDQNTDAKFRRMILRMREPIVVTGDANVDAIVQQLQNLPQAVADEIGNRLRS